MLILREWVLKCGPFRILSAYIINIYLRIHSAGATEEEEKEEERRRGKKKTTSSISLSIIQRSYTIVYMTISHTHPHKKRRKDRYE